MRRCEWRLLDGWPLARAAAAELGFQEEGRLPEACFRAGRYEDVVLTGLLAAEARVAA
jgi:RimJ/RimL family protein N-acetyltransferase